MENKEGFSEVEIKQMESSLSNIVDSRLKPIQQWQSEKDKADIANQQALDGLLMKMKDMSRSGHTTDEEGGTFANQIAAQLKGKASEIEQFQRHKDAKITIELKTVGTMTTGNITGDGVASYSARQGLVPAQKLNFRDIIPSVTSHTGIYVSYRETGSEGSIGDQTEGESKEQLDYDLTEVKTVSGYVAGYTRFSKQLMKHLPFLETTLPRLLLRDFYKAENTKIYNKIWQGATGFNTPTDWDDQAKIIVDILMGRRNQDFNNSYILCNHNQVGQILKLLYENGNYFGAGSIVGTQNGQVEIAGTPLIGASFALEDRLLFVDTDFVERVETESLRVEFSYDDQDNFTRNLVSARVECFEDVNLLRTDAHSKVDLTSES